MKTTLKQHQNGWKYDIKVPFGFFVALIKIYFQNIRNQYIFKVNKKYFHLVVGIFIFKEPSSQHIP
jgi:hypothetical protein